MKERSKEMGSSRRTAEEIFRDYSGRRTDAVHALTNEREVEQGFVRFGQLGLPPTSGINLFLVFALIFLWKFWRMLCSMTIIVKLITQRNLLLVVIEGA
ncbi:uncharacterized protein [Malus domestica]|uniref:uncharacterized protein isoform X1 n=1 Tax=Malus domestica TaxID=3750 RepID=UPI003974BBC1